MNTRQKAKKCKLMYEALLSRSKQKTGHWTHDGSDWTNRWICPECGYKLYDEQSRFCPECGSYNGGIK